MLILVGYRRFTDSDKVVLEKDDGSLSLTYWTRDRTRGERLPLEWMVKKQILDNARFFGLHGRGAIRPGLKADLNVLDYDALEVSRPYLVDDLTGGAKRLMQTATGYTATVAAG